MSWHKDRFIESASKIKVDCVICQKSMWLPPSKAGKYVTCGADCTSKRYSSMGNQDRHRVKEVKIRRVWNCKFCGIEQVGGKSSKVFCSATCLKSHRDHSSSVLSSERTKVCKNCGSKFIVKKSQIDAGHGDYCSHKCAYASKTHLYLSSPENMEKAHEARRKSIAVNGSKHKRGPENHAWKGGPEASRKRALPRTVAYTKEYRKRNPQMMRESAKKRRGIGRLPRGTIATIGAYQRWKCAVCAVNVKKKYHVDHIQPIARGGLHEPNNIQLLCPSCNLRKNAKDPIKFMQERGFLL